MSGNGTTGRAMGVDAGRWVYAATFVWLGILGLQAGGFTAIWSGVPRALPARAALAYATAAICLLTGLGMLWRRTAAAAAGALLAYFALWILVFRLPLVVQAPLTTPPWWVCGEAAVMMAGAWAVFVAMDHGARGGAISGPLGLRAAQVLFGLGLIPFGVAHFTFFAHTVDVVPKWLPWRPAWAALTGAAFIAAGVAIVTGVLGRLAAKLAAWQVGLLTAIVWVPIVLRGNVSPGDWLEFVDSCALAAAAWAVAESYR